MAGASTKSSRLNLFETADKILLISEVEKRPILWDLTDKKHFDSAMINTAWESVAETLNRSVTDCKLAWKRLRDSYRYHCKVAANKRRSGSAGGIGPEQPRAKDEVEWQLAPYMAFLPDLSSQRRGINPSTNQALSLDDSSCSLSSTMEFEPIQLDADASTSLEAASYSYYTPNKRRKVEKPKAKSEEVFNMLENVMSKQEEILKSSDPAPPIRTIVRYWDEALQKMDPEQAEETEQAMTQVLWQRQAAYKNKK
ncbi:hypothetical protein ACLKA6_001761 [Drosophila palustris]